MRHLLFVGLLAVAGITKNCTPATPATTSTAIEAPVDSTYYQAAQAWHGTPPTSADTSYCPGGNIRQARSEGE